MTPSPEPEFVCCWPGRCPKNATVRITEYERYCRPHAVQVADREARLWAMEHFGWTCQRCKGPAHDVHHILGKGSHPRLRHERLNLLPLCRTDHTWAHHNRRAFSDWVNADTDRLHALVLLERRTVQGHWLADAIRGFREERLTPAEFEQYRSGAWLGR